jgi:predicted DCC family thiol-disulfide oxidoreductase YuxK
LAPGPKARDVILFDGVCGLCDRFVRFVLPRDQAERFLFAPLQGAWARGVLARHGRDAEDLDTLWVVRDAGTPRESLLARARASLHVLRALGLPWSAAATLGVLPGPVLDAAYGLVARWRYRLFGRRAACAVPPVGFERRFVGSGALEPSSR